MGNITEQFIDRIYQLSKSELEPMLVLQAKRCLLDYIAVTIGGSAINKKKLENYIGDEQGSYSLIGINSKVSLHSAVLINAYNAHVLELDDGHRKGMLHIGAVVFSGLLSVAEQRECTIQDLYTGAVIGYETAIRLARAIQPNHKKKGFHATGTCGTVGCAMGIAAMLGYSRQEMMNAMSAAMTTASGLLEVITGKSEQKPYNIANAANAGVNAALFGKYFQGPEDILNGNRGFLKNFSDVYDEKQLVKDALDYAINGIYMKPYAACRHCHAPIEAAIILGNDKIVNLTDIEEISVATYSLAVFGHEHQEIEGINSAKMSIPYGVAAALLFHRAGLDMFTEKMIKNEAILCLAKKIRVYEDDELTKLAPEKRAAIVSIRYKNEYEQKMRVDYPKGEPENPMSDSELMEKFYSLAASAGMEEAVQRICRFLEDKKKCKVSELMDVINEEVE